MPALIHDTRASPSESSELSKPSEPVSVWPGPGPCELYVAARTNEIGVVVYAAGPFADEADARNHVAGAFGGQGHPVPLELVFSSPRPP